MLLQGSKRIVMVDSLTRFSEFIDSSVLGLPPGTLAFEEEGKVRHTPSHFTHRHNIHILTLTHFIYTHISRWWNSPIFGSWCSNKFPSKYPPLCTFVGVVWSSRWRTRLKCLTFILCYVRSITSRTSEMWGYMLYMHAACLNMHAACLNMHATCIVHVCLNMHVTCTVLFQHACYMYCTSMLHVLYMCMAIIIECCIIIDFLWGQGQSGCEVCWWTAAEAHQSWCWDYRKGSVC